MGKGSAGSPWWLSLQLCYMALQCPVTVARLVCDFLLEKLSYEPSLEDQQFILASISGTSPCLISSCVLDPRRSQNPVKRQSFTVGEYRSDIAGSYNIECNLRFFMSAWLLLPFCRPELSRKRKIPQ
ncbi:hypothetical protein BDU57DRAFT_211712 [Ampelomyces quisqualis]|uniref:Uncharacterized protein n=1 Tax=Ampelomyces quisqualis TaxID=50730 RepID=A0A6A5QMP6_AMPQU|nr:hypothetical protein BDU57DRAFT_211712 [Ampelomyces quisqualis]